VGRKDPSLEWLMPCRRSLASAVVASLLVLTACSNVEESPEAVRGGPVWPLPTDVAAKAEAAGLGFGPMGMAEHYHPKLQILVNGEQILIPANIGVDPSTGSMSAVHTHTPDGVIHIEAAKTGQKFTLGQLFIQWDVPLSSTQVGDLRPSGGVAVTVNGRSYAGDPASLRLEPEQAITLDLG